MDIDEQSIRTKVVEKLKDNAVALLIALPTFGLVIPMVLEGSGTLIGHDKENIVFRCFTALYFTLPSLLVFAWFVRDLERRKKGSSNGILALVACSVIIGWITISFLIPYSTFRFASSILIIKLLFLIAFVLGLRLWLSNALKVYEEPWQIFLPLCFFALSMICYYNMLLPWESASYSLASQSKLPICWPVVFSIGVFWAFSLYYLQSTRRRIELTRGARSYCALLMIFVGAAMYWIWDPINPEFRSDAFSSREAYFGQFEADNNLRETHHDLELASENLNALRARTLIQQIEYSALPEVSPELASSWIDLTDLRIARLKLTRARINEQAKLDESKTFWSFVLMQVQWRGIFLLIATILLLVLLWFFLDSKAQFLRGRLKTNFDVVREDQFSRALMDCGTKKGTVVFFIALQIMLLVPLVRPIDKDRIDPQKPFWMLSMPNWYIPGYFGGVAGEFQNASNIMMASTVTNGSNGRDGAGLKDSLQEPVDSRVVPGPQGLVGPRGLKGDRGLPGAPGTPGQRGLDGVTTIRIVQDPSDSILIKTTLDAIKSLDHNSELNDLNRFRALLSKFESLRQAIRGKEVKDTGEADNYLREIEMIMKRCQGSEFSVPESDLAPIDDWKPRLSGKPLDVNGFYHY